MIITTDNYWDCECKSHYIHPKTTLICPRCGADQEEMPDARINELFQADTMAPEVDNG